MNKPNETLEHYETMARAALYPDLVKALEAIVGSGKLPSVEACEQARALLSRLPERDKG